MPQNNDMTPAGVAAPAATDGPATASSSSLTALSCASFASELASRKPVPGGGGAAAYVGALAAALCSMVGNFTVGKPRYADVEADVRRAMAQADAARDDLLSLVDDDARAYALVSAAYALPRDAAGRVAAIQAALPEAARPPLAIIEASARAVEALEVLGQKGSRILQSDVACGAAMAVAAMRAASVSVYVNTASIDDPLIARGLDERCDALLGEWVPRAEALLDSFVGDLRKES